MERRAAAWSAAVLTLAVAAGGAWGQTPRVKRTGAYERLDNVKLAHRLGELGMIAILEGLKDELDKGTDELAKLVVDAELHVAKAYHFAAAGDAAQWSKELDEAITHLRKTVEKEPREDVGAAWMGYFRARFLLANTLALKKGNAYAQAALGLLADDKEMAALEDLTAEAIYHLETFSEDLERKLQDWRGNIADVLTKVPDGERLQEELRYDSARIYLYRSLSLPEAGALTQARTDIEQAVAAAGDKRRELLEEALRLLGGAYDQPGKKPVGDLQVVRDQVREILAAPQSDAKLFSRASGRITGVLRARQRYLDKAIALVDPYVKPTVPADLRYWSLLLQGTAARELARNDEAATLLGAIRQAASVPGGLVGVSGDVLPQAMFQLARNQVERPNVEAEAGIKGIQDYVDTCLKLTDPSLHSGIEIRSCLLKIYLYDRLSQAAKDAKDAQKAALHQLDACEAMFTFEDQYGQTLKKIAEAKAAGKDASALEKRLDSLKDLQMGVFRLLAQKLQGRLADASLDPLYRDTIQLAVIVRDSAASKDDQAVRSALESLNKMLQEPMPASLPAAVAARAKTLQERIRARVHLQAGWMLFLLQENEKNSNRRWPLVKDAAAHWRAVAKDSPNHPMAFEAAKNAVLVFRLMMKDEQDAGRLLTKEFYEEYDKALGVLLDHWGQRPEIQPLRADLAQVRMYLAGDKMTPEALENILAAIDAFEKTPKGDKHYMEDCYAALTKRFELLAKKSKWLEAIQKCPDAARRQKLAKAFEAYADEAYLVEHLKQFAVDAKAMLKDDKAASREELTNWGSSAALRAAEILAIQGSREKKPELTDQAIALVKAVQQDWAATPAASEALFLEQELKLERGDPSGIEGIIRIMKDKPEEAQRLLPGIYRIRDPSRDMVKSGVREPYAKRYEQFSKIIYDHLKGRPDNDGPRYDAVRTYADALLENGKPAESLPIWQEAKKLDDMRLNGLKAQIDAQVAGWVDRAEKAAASLRLLKELAAECQKAFEEKGVYGSSIEQLKRLLPKAEDPKPLSKAIITACKGYGELSKLNFAADAEVVEGLARAYQGVGKYAEAMPLYKRVLPSLPGGSERYWMIQREYSTCWLNALKDDKDAMGALVTHIKLLGAENRPEFRDILTQAQRYAAGG